MISFIVPAHNEASYIGRTLASIHEAARAVATVGTAYEIIVVDDASTDGTAEIGRQHGATVVSVRHRQIAATRNSGARAAVGERLFFVDADTAINADVLAAAMRVMDRGAAGGGARARFDGRVPLFARLLLFWLGLLMKLAEMSGGAFMFATREAFQAVGGFDERLFGAEDAAMSLALKREGRFVVLWRTVLTSGRRVRQLGGLRMLTALFRMAFFPSMLRNRSSVESIWYESNRDVEEEVSESLGVRATNILLLLFVVAMLPIWIFIPQWLTPVGSPLWNVRVGMGLVGCHVSLVLWPCAFLLARTLLRQKRWVERIKLAALICVCLWFAWNGSRHVYWFWTGIYQGAVGTEVVDAMR
jgi:glycosyltransferase involved in cell wall biosynthesis